MELRQETLDRVRRMAMSDLTQRIVDFQDAAFSKEGIRTIHLLEASAGTGKTYSIQTLYLRLILVEGLTVQQILVVTFTRDATKELRDRLQRILHEALDHLGGRPDEERTRKLVDKAVTDQGEGKIRERLQLALLDFDMASIFTIHGFCQRVLNRFAFETRQPFEVEPAGDTSDEIEQLCKDWWRKNLYLMDEEITGFLSVNTGFSLNAITALAGKLISKPDAVLVGGHAQGMPVDQVIRELLRNFPLQGGEGCTFGACQEAIRRPLLVMVEKLKEFRGHVAGERWEKALSVLFVVCDMADRIPNPCCDLEIKLQEACEAFKQVTSGAKVSQYEVDGKGCLKHSGKPQLRPEHSTAVGDVVRELDAIIESCGPVEVFKRNKGEPVKAFQYLDLLRRHFVPKPGGPPVTAAELADSIKEISKGGIGIVDEVTITSDAISPLFGELASSLAETCRNEVVRAAMEVKDQYRKGRPAATTASFDDYLLNLREALKDPVGGKDLVDVLRKEFCAALIDEFQDTDPIQWGIFERLF